MVGASSLRLSAPAMRRRYTRLIVVALVLVVIGAGCGTTVGSRTSGASPAARRGLPTSAVTSMSCSATTTSTSQRAAVPSCVFVLTDGRRFKCAGSTLARSTPNPRTLEQAKACLSLSPLTIPPSLRAVTTRIAADRACLTNKGLRVTGGPVIPSQGPNSPDGELITADAFIAFYTDTDKAQRLEPQVKRNARPFGGQVVRRGAVTVLWIRVPASALRNAVSDCAFG